MTHPEFNDIEDHLDGLAGKSFADLSAGMDAAETADLRERIEQQRDLRLAVGAAGLRRHLEEIRMRKGSQETKTPPREAAERSAGFGKRLKVVLIIAAILLLVTVAYFLFRPTDEGVYATYEYRDPGLPVVMNVTADPAFNEAMTLFKQGEFTAARAAFSSLAPSTNDTLVYYRGASAYYAGDLEVAADDLERVTNDDGSLFQERANYLLALTLLKAGRREEGRKRLEYIVTQDGHRFRDRAERLISKLVN